MPVAARIAAVEEGLLPARLLRGRPRRRMRLMERMAHHKVVGASVAVIERGRIDWAKGYGLLEAGRSDGVDERTLFQACSISKAIAATAALALIERGLLDLDQPVNECLRSWKLAENELTKSNPVTLRQLLSHRAGTTVHGFPGYTAGAKLPSITQILDGEPPSNTAPVRVERSPGSAFQYSGGGFTIVQLLIEDVTGRPFAEVVGETVLEVAGMQNSSYRQPRPEGAASGHSGDGSLLPGRWHIHPELAAAGLWTTPSDLARWAIEVQRARSGRSPLLAKGLAQQMLMPEGGGPTGLGLAIAGEGEGLRFSHSGANAGYRCDLVCLCVRGQGAVVMTNADTGDRLCWEIMNGIADVYGWPDYLVEKDVAEIAPSLFERYAGSYRSELLNITVRREGGRLFAVATGFGEHEFFPESETEFFLTDVPADVSFEVAGDSAAPGLVLRAFGFELHAKRVT